MGAWQVQPKTGDSATSNGDNVMRQVSPVWPACWGYSCSGPLTYFGPAGFNASGGLTMKIDVMIEEEDATFSLLGLVGQSKTGIEINSGNGSWSFTGTGQSTVGGITDFKAGVFHSLAMHVNTTMITASLDGKVLGSSPLKHMQDGFYIAMGLDKYVYAQVDNWSLSVDEHLA